MYCKIQTCALEGLTPHPVLLEVDMSPGLPSFSMVGSLGGEVRESRDRVLSALGSMNIHLPAAHVTVNFSPANIHKEGTAFDLPLAIGILCVNNVLNPEEIEDTLFLGELGLNGDLHPVCGVLPIIQKAAALGIKNCIVPAPNAKEGAVVPGICVRGANSLSELIRFFQTTRDSSCADAILPATHVDIETLFHKDCNETITDFSDIAGQENAKRAAVIAAAGFHSLLMTGPPGAGKSMIASRIPGILPPLTLEESLEVTAIQSVAGRLPPDQALITKRLFEHPHHSISGPALLGGGMDPRPGIISLAHRSVLFLDELTEFNKETLDGLRQPLEEHIIYIARAKKAVTYPADFLLVCAMNPCPCGYYPDTNRCHCSSQTIHRYLGKISGPILDRIDLCVSLEPVKIEHILSNQKNQSSKFMMEQVEKARELQKERYKGSTYRFNAELSAPDIDTYCELGTKEKSYVRSMYQSLHMSARGYHRTMKVARTIADLDGSDHITCTHLTEASLFRPNETYWNR